MDRHIKALLNKVSFCFIAIATLTLVLLVSRTPDTCINPPSIPIHKRHHHRFPKSSCDAAHRSFTSLEKRNRRLWSTKTWLNAVSSFSSLFLDLQTRSHLSNHSRVLCVSAGAGQEVMALHRLGVSDVTGVELIDSPPLVSRADPHNLPFFDDVFDLGFSAHLDQALFPSQYAAEMERTVRAGGICVVVVDESGDQEVNQVAKLFRKSKFLEAKNVTLIGSKMTRIIVRISISNPP